METLDFAGSGRRGARVPSGPCQRLIVFPGSVSRAQVRVEPGRGVVRVPNGSRVGARLFLLRTRCVNRCRRPRHIKNFRSLYGFPVSVFGVSQPVISLLAC